MPVYYAQILNKNTKKILTASFSYSGSSLKTNTEILIELKNISNSIPLEDKIYSFHSKSRQCIFYYKVINDIIFVAISDLRMSDKLIQNYFDSLSIEYKKFAGKMPNVVHYEFDDSLKAITDIFNKKSNVLSSVEELETTHTALVENLDSLINRGENINNLKDLADKVSMETREMSKRVSDMKFQQKMEQYKIYIILAIILILAIYFLFIR